MRTGQAWETTLIGAVGERVISRVDGQTPSEQRHGPGRTAVVGERSKATL